MTVLCFDIECNGIKPSEIFVLGVLNYETDEYHSYTGEQIPIGLLKLAEADRLFGHHVKGFDIPHIERLTNGLIRFDPLIVDDTLEMSRAAFPKLDNHKLETWGDIFGYPKIKYDKGFDRFHPEMVPYCEVDCRLTKKLYDFLLEQIQSD